MQDYNNNIHFGADSMVIFRATEENHDHGYSNIAIKPTSKMLLLQQAFLQILFINITSDSYYMHL